MTQEHFSNTALNLTRGDVGFYVTAMSPNDILKFARVSRVSEDLVKGFQRTLEISRAKKISNYIIDGHVLPGAIILSAQSSLNITYDEATSKISFPIIEGSFLVIDGQHRLYGSHIAEQAGQQNIKLPVCILCGLNLTKEVEYFIDINSNQKGVPKTLRIELTKFIAEPDSIDQIRLQLFEDLNNEEDSPLSTKLSAIQRAPGYLSHVPFEIALNKTLASSPLKDFSYEHKKKLIKNYLIGVSKNLSEIGHERKLTQSAFFQAIFRVYDKACEQALMFGQKYSAESFTTVFECLQNLDFEDRHTGTNEEAITKLAEDISHLLDIQYKTKTPNDLF
ncbi:DGQHR domain-containing protein [Pseudomonas aeruginosa]|uniref:DGQHR domain-containing protein n=1 Tax=Pseudomonas aeruginosa TaxID=287 RepID=UPI0009A31385|nr:DGQHR domain-containing protein [Pseudomonas aeruginosa]MCX5485025.1 DGQHR domain-containing protein [Pseudomonas aeruginosa]MCX5491442.1 DGQHR domain-containing protein [Pseudomonas aeruginosa]HCW0551778.1 DGQHR domain-containing protein [Pseudomonas aeruginosa]HCW0559414.1 DGQHR domain-containing protein [Pseudomonas aeruginosa]HCW0948236.1 DGQHR domain-containing protein [Pseudomonas aeruginosa]